ncbi:UNVERIFIED_CONTAM: DDE superfamily endonuclease [Williamsia faeni]
MLVVDEAGDLKKGTNTVGVQRQYTGSAARTENCQVAVYLTYAAAGGHTLIDRALYLPQHTWATDPARRAKAGVPDTVELATRPALATSLIEAALDADVPASGVAGDGVYGADPNLRQALHDRQIGYVLAVGCNRQVPTEARKVRVDALTAALPPRAWHKMSASPGSKGHRWFFSALIATTERPDIGGCHVLVRRTDNTHELAFHRCYSPTPVPPHLYVRVAGGGGRSRNRSRPAKA